MLHLQHFPEMQEKSW